MELTFEHYEQAGQLCTSIVVPEVAATPITTDATQIGEVPGVPAHPFQSAVANPSIDGPGPEITRYQGTEPTKPNYDPERAGQITDDFDKPAWFRIQTKQIKALLIANAPDIRTPIEVP